MERRLSAQRKHTHALAEHANSAQKGPKWDYKKGFLVQMLLQSQFGVKIVLDLATKTKSQIRFMKAYVLLCNNTPIIYPSVKNLCSRCGNEPKTFSLNLHSMSCCAKAVRIMFITIIKCNIQYSFMTSAQKKKSNKKMEKENIYGRQEHQTTQHKHL